MKYSLPSRELIADSVETMMRAHCFDGMVCIPNCDKEIIADSVETMLKAHCFDGMICIPNCDKIVPGMLMAAMRCNIPTIFVSGGPMEAGMTQRRAGRRPDRPSSRGWRHLSGRQDHRRRSCTKLEETGCPTCGSCSGMFTANSMNCLCEALGMALPGNGTSWPSTRSARRSTAGGAG